MSNNLLKELKGNEKGFAIIGAIIVIVIVGMISLGIMISSSGEAKLVQNSFESTQALYVAETTLNGIALELNTCSNWDDSVWADVTILNTAAGSAQLDSMVFSDAAKTVDVMLTATYKGEQRQIQSTIYYNGCGGEANVQGAASIKASAPRANGTLTIDGRNHDRDCTTVINNSGTYAMAMKETEGSFNFTGNANLGATESGTDYAPDHTLDNRVLFGATDLPDSADDVFGYDEGTLKLKAEANGAYYNDPGNGAFTVKNGLNYIEMPCASTKNKANIWQPSTIMNKDNDATNAILVIHSACNDAEYNAMEGGFFRGIMITDYIDLLHTNINGAILALGNGNEGGNIGNGDATICYSSQVLDDAIRDSGVDKPTLTISGWQENPI